MWQTSVQQEAKELCNKITKLESFINLNQTEAMQSLLVQQLECMKKYHKILVQRLELAEQEENCIECWTDADSVFC